MKNLKRLSYLLITLLFCYILYTLTTNKKEQFSYYSSIEKETYIFDTNQNNILIDSSGIVVFVPQYAFIDDNGNIIKDSVTIEFRSINKLTDLIIEGINTSNPNLALNSDLVFNLNAQHKEKQLLINPENPIYVEIISPDETGDWQLFRGSESNKEQIEWQQDKTRIKYLIPFKLKYLDFYPEGFVETAENNLPFRDHYSISKELLDSLYYSFAINQTHTTKTEEAGFIPWPQDGTVATYEAEGVSYGIDPASIAALKTRLFENTYISTREYERRLKTIFKTCDERILEIYIDNIANNLYIADSLAADYLQKQNLHSKAFLEFYNEKLTNTKNAPKRLARLAKYYQKQKEDIRKALEKERASYLKEIEKQKQIVKQENKLYEQLLVKRNQIRKERFGFELTETGWYNFAKKIALEELDTFEIEVNVTNGDQFDRVHTYVINPEIKSIFALFSNNKQTFNMAHELDKELLLKKGQSFNIVSVGYEKNKPALNEIKCLQKKQIEETLTLQSLNENSLKARLKKYTKYDKANNIMVDLKKQFFFYQENLRREKWMQDQAYIYQLRSVVFPCYKGSKGE